MYKILIAIQLAIILLMSTVYNCEVYWYGKDGKSFDTITVSIFKK